MTYPFLPQTSPAYAAVGRMVSGVLTAALLLGALSDDIAVAQVTTVNVTSSHTSSTYSMKVVATGDWGFSLSRTVEYESAGSTSQQAIANGLTAAALADAELGTIATAEAGTNALTLTATRGGAGYTFTVTFPSNPSTDLTQTATTAAADAPTYYFGRVCELVGASGPNPTVQPVSALTPSTLTYAVTHGAGATYAGTFTVQNPDGVEQSVSWSASAGANLAATLAAVNAAITTQVAGITGALVSDATSPNVVLSLPLGWGSIVPLTTSATGGGGSPAMTATADEGDTVPTYLFIRDPQDQAPIRGQATNTIATVDGGQPRVVPVVTGGGCNWAAEIASGATCTPGAQVYVETAAGSTQGRITPTPSTTAAPMRSRNRVAVVFSQTDPSGGASAAITI